MEETSAAQPSARLLVYHVTRGLGNACALVFPDGSLGVVDWGTNDEGPLADLIARATGHRIRFVAATHPHLDHTLGLEALLRRCARDGVNVDRFVFPVLSRTVSPKSSRHNPLVRAVIAAYQLRVPLEPVCVSELADPDTRPPAVARDEEWEVRVLAPSSTGVGNEEARAILGGTVAGNATSLVLGFLFRRDAARRESLGRVLLPGDATPKTLKFARDTAAKFPELTLANEAVVVPHHGGAQLPEWFVESMKRVAVVSAPSESVKHAHADTLTRIAAGGVQAFCTSYAEACARAFGRRAKRKDKALVAPGPCFGDVVVEVPMTAPATLVTSSAPGEERRAFGLCGHRA